MTRGRMWLVAVVLAACGGKKEEAPAATGSARPPAIAEEEIAHTFVSKPLQAKTGRAGGVEYTIDLPEDASAPRIAGDGTIYDFKGSGLQIGITAVASPLRADDLTKKRELADKTAEVLLRADQISADSYVVAKGRKDQTWFQFEHCRNIPYGNVCCAATLRTEKPFIQTSRVIAWVTNVCQHVSIAGEPHSAPVIVDPTTIKR